MAHRVAGQPRLRRADYTDCADRPPRELAENRPIGWTTHFAPPSLWRCSDARESHHRGGRNSRKERGTAQAKDDAVVAAELENYLKGVAKHFIQRVYGPAGMPWGTKFADLEDIAVQLGQAASRDMIEQAAARQAAAVPDEAERCGGCDEPITPAERVEPRAAAAQVAAARWDEPKRCCPRCRAAFPPSVAGFGD